MKPKNFPGKKNDRRIKVLDRLEKNLTIPVPATLDTKMQEQRVTRIKNELVILKSRIIEPAMARGMRTKKFRG